MASKIGRIFARGYSSTPKAHKLGHHEGAEEGERLWRRLTFFVCIPAVILTMAHVYINYPEHERPEFIPYEHLRIRKKPFPWGDGNRTLFHNPKYNALPTGYED